jgi:hypothetical protein
MLVLDFNLTFELTKLLLHAVETEDTLSHRYHEVTHFNIKQYQLRNIRDKLSYT